MPNIPEPTPAPTAAAAAALGAPALELVRRNATLPADWTVPASCATNVPTLYHGTCNEAACTQNAATAAAADMASGLWVNYPMYTRQGVLTSTACMPPGYSPVVGFAFRSATGCPASWSTATAFPTGSGGSLLGVVCCPT